MDVCTHVLAWLRPRRDGREIHPGTHFALEFDNCASTYQSQLRQEDGGGD